ncbi:hypothetical protein D3C81_937400 [compost metagenome]
MYVHHAVLQGLERADRHAELLAFPGVGNGVGEHLLHHADRLGAQRQHGFVEYRFEQLQALVLLADQYGNRHANVVEPDFRGPPAIDGGVILGADAGAVPVHQQQADAVAVAAFAVGAHTHQQVGRPRRAEHHGLVAAHYVSVAIAPRAGLDVVQAMPAAGLALRPGDAHIAGHDGGDYPLGQFTAGTLEQPAADHHGGQVGLQHEGAAEGLHDDLVLDHAAAKPTERLGECGGENAQLAGERLPAFGAPALRRSHGRHAPVEAVLLVQIAREHVAQHLLLIAELEIHRAFLHVCPRAPRHR